jgi:mRNA interferase RelE/StbE
LATDPRPDGVKKLVDEDNLRRVRVGDYRIVYTIEDGKLRVLIIRLAHRSDSYKD